MQRRTFLSSWLASAVQPGWAAEPRVDFRYAPQVQQATFCFPDDPYKSLVGEKGDLRYGYNRRKHINYFTEVVNFELAGSGRQPAVMQRLEAPGVPIVHTRMEYDEAWLELTTFASNREGEGRVDNVIMEVRPKSQRRLWAAPVVTVRTRRALEAGFVVADRPLRSSETGDGYRFMLPEGSAPFRCFLRFPQQGRPVQPENADTVLAEAREWWRRWRPFAGQIGWKLPGVYQDFLQACTRNILQARERVNGNLTFQVGPTTYRGLWVVDGNFILEAARYLGYDEDAQRGLETTWGMQATDGSIVAGGGKEHWKDTAIAMFTMVRQAELSQDWSYFRRMRPQVLAAVRLLESLRELARKENSSNGRYGLLAKGFGDGGIGGGVREELTNTLWALVGLKAAGAAGHAEAAWLAAALEPALFACIRHEMRRHPEEFEFLPMILKDDPLWNDPDERKRWRLQSGQWALAQSIFPGRLFAPDDPVVKGYLALMKACTHEDIPAETGWSAHEGVWNYDAAFCAHAALWAGERDYALATFTGFLNHATPLYCWREEQPLQNALIGSHVGDMPHNWASAECVLFLRHMLALEDGDTLRLLAGIDGGIVDSWQIANSPTRFGRVSLLLEPQRQGWRLRFERARGPAPAAVRLPASLGRATFAETRGAKWTRPHGIVEVDPQAASWEAIYR